MKINHIVILFPFLLACNKDIQQDVISFEPIPMNKASKVEFKEPEKLIRFVDNEENGYLKNKTIENIKYSSFLKPIEYLLAQKRISENNPAVKSSDFEDLQYFDLRIEVKDFKMEFIKYDIETPEQYEERVKYCAFDMQNNIKLIDGNDTLSCLLYHYERAFNVVPYGHFILGFENKNKKLIETKTLCFEDKLFNKGMIKFTYAPQTIAKQPVLL